MSLYRCRYTPSSYRLSDCHDYIFGLVQDERTAMLLVAAVRMMKSLLVAAVGFAVLETEKKNIFVIL